jgi:hypothetical protein
VLQLEEQKKEEKRLRQEAKEMKRLQKEQEERRRLEEEELAREGLALARKAAEASLMSHERRSHSSSAIALATSASPSSPPRSVAMNDGPAADNVADVALANPLLSALPRSLGNDLHARALAAVMGMQTAKEGQQQVNKQQWQAPVPQQQLVTMTEGVVLKALAQAVSSSLNGNGDDSGRGGSVPTRRGRAGGNTKRRLPARSCLPMSGRRNFSGKVKARKPRPHSNAEGTATGAAQLRVMRITMELTPIVLPLALRI